jgi:hypothetical protein
VVGGGAALHVLEPAEPDGEHDGACECDGFLRCILLQLLLLDVLSGCVVGPGGGGR